MLYVKDTVFKENVGFHGGGIFVPNSSNTIELVGAKFFDNVATASSSGAISATSVDTLDTISVRRSSGNGCEGIYESSVGVCHLFAGGVTGCISDGFACRDGIGCCDNLKCTVNNDVGVEICAVESVTPPRIGSYHGTECNVNGPVPSSLRTTVARFLVFGDTPYDNEIAAPFEGPEYNCMRKVALPGVKELKGSVDFIAHVGDIKKGGDAFSSYCNHQVFGSRRNLFEMVETDLDFLMVVGDNEWNECNGYSSNPHVDDIAKTMWRNYFTNGKFADFDHILPFGGHVAVERQLGKPENFFFYYQEQRVAFFGITEPMKEDQYDAINADWIQGKLSDKTPEAIVVFGHDSKLSNKVRASIPAHTPTLYVAGNLHKYCMKFLDHDNLLQLTVDPFLAAPLLVSIVKDDLGNHFFHAETTPYGCK